MGIFHAMNHGTREFVHDKFQRNESLWAAPLKLLCKWPCEKETFLVSKTSKKCTSMVHTTLDEMQRISGGKAYTGYPTKNSSH